jgi:hypothetical protein
MPCGSEEEIERSLGLSSIEVQYGLWELASRVSLLPTDSTNSGR